MLHLKLLSQLLPGAARTGEIEQLRGITENVIVGSQIPIGSGTVDLYMQVAKKRGSNKS